jgi:hypothetical protein
VEELERLNRAQAAEGGPGLGRRLGRADFDGRETELVAGELPVIGDRILGGASVVVLGGLVGACGFRRPTLPVGGAGDGDRRLGNLAGGCKMPSAKVGSLRNRRAIQPAWNSASMRWALDSAPCPLATS